jgi:hypothetical protein
MTQPLQANLKGWPFAAAQCVIDKARDEELQYFTTKAMFENCMEDATIIPRYYDTYRNWITSSTNNNITGLDAFPVTAYSNGTTESFDKFYLKHNTRRFRCFRGEYMYHRVAWRNYFPNWAFIDDEPIREGDAVVCSLPFADTGDVHPAFTNDFLDDCHAKGVPVLIDAAFYGIVGNLEYNFDHPAITDITFSLSKSFPVNYVRIGIRFTRIDDDDSLLVYHKTQYVNRLGASIGLKFLQKHTCDDIYNTYRTRQLDWCDRMGLQPSNTVIFGIDYNHRYDHYNRGMPDTNRLCFAKYYNSGIMPQDIKSE